MFVLLLFVALDLASDAVSLPAWGYISLGVLGFIWAVVNGIVQK